MHAQLEPPDLTQRIRGRPVADPPADEGPRRHRGVTVAESHQHHRCCGPPTAAQIVATTDRADCAGHRPERRRGPQRRRRAGRTGQTQQPGQRGQRLMSGGVVEGRLLEFMGQLPSLVGEARARELILLGEIVDHQKALRTGSANQVVAENDLDTAAQRLPERLTAQPPLAVSGARRALTPLGITTARRVCGSPWGNKLGASFQKTSFRHAERSPKDANRSGRDVEVPRWRTWCRSRRFRRPLAFEDVSTGEGFCGRANTGSVTALPGEAVTLSAAANGFLSSPQKAHRGPGGTWCPDPRCSATGALAAGRRSRRGVARRSVRVADGWAG